MLETLVVRLYILSVLAVHHPFYNYIYDKLTACHMIYMYCKSKFQKVGTLPIWIVIVKSNVSNVDPLFSLELYYPYRQYTNPVRFQFVPEHCLCSALHLFHYLLQI